VSVAILVRVRTAIYAGLRWGDLQVGDLSVTGFRAPLKSSAHLVPISLTGHNLKYKPRDC